MGREGEREYGKIRRPARHTERERIDAVTARTAGTPTIVLRAYPYSVWECTGRFIMATACAFRRAGVFRCRQEYLTESRLAGGAERLQGPRVYGHSPARLLGQSPSSWPLAAIALAVLGSARRPAFPVPQRYGDCRCVSRLGVQYWRERIFRCRDFVWKLILRSGPPTPHPPRTGRSPLPARRRGARIPPGRRPTPRTARSRRAGRPASRLPGRRAFRRPPLAR
jgi:hypothetical protein